MLFRYFVGWLVMMVLYLTVSPGMKCTDIVKSLTQLLDHYKDSSSLSRDVHFGLNLAYKILLGCRNPHLEGSDGDRNEFYWKTLEYLKLLKSSSHTRNVSVYDEIILKSISKSSGVWQYAIRHRHLDVRMAKDTFRDYEWIVDTGLPSTIDSDMCIAQLGSTKSCVISSRCLGMMVSPQPAYGYHKTHQQVREKDGKETDIMDSTIIARHLEWEEHPKTPYINISLLFLLILVLNGCSNHLPIDVSIDFIIQSKCSDIYKENKILSKRGVPHDYRDLFIEQSLFCGIFGYSEFLETSTVSLISSWHDTNGNGCFDSSPPLKSENINLKCMNHINSLGIAFYANLMAKM